VIALTVSLVTPASAQVSFSLVVSPDTVSFPDANPTTTPSIPASAAVVWGVKVQVPLADMAAPWSASALSNGDLQSGPDTIAIPNVSWTSVDVSAVKCTNCTCFAGTASSVASQLVFAGTGSTDGFTCRATFSLANSWSYDPGSYSQTMVITASSP
jgi:hypothetical protein